jgi:carbon-monoxide dehydrogenase large subunit
MKPFAIGESVPRFEDRRLLRGGGQYLDDVKLPGMAHGCVLRSPHPHARIRKIDVSAALAMPGVIAVLTGEDWEKSGFADLPNAGGKTKRDGSPMYRPRFPALVKDRVRYVGDPVAFVVAESVNQALDGCDAIEVDYEPLPSVSIASEAIEDGAPLVWDDCPNNICLVHLEGDKAAVDKAFESADKIVSQKLIISRVTAATMEPRGAAGYYDPASERYTLHTPIQRSLHYREEMAQVLRVPESQVRIIGGDIGGSFGMKTGLFNEAAIVLLAAKTIGRPVKWMSTRAESFISDAHGRDNATDVSLALDKNGKFLAMRVKTILNIGSYTQPGSELATFANIGSLAGVYTMPAIHVDATGVFTNTNPMRPYRGNGRPEAAYVVERIIDIAADEMGIDPAELRRRNMIPPEAMPYQTALSFKYDCGEFEHVMDEALEEADYHGFAARRAEARKRGKLRGLGLSYTIERAAQPGYEGADIRFDRSGSLTLVTGAVAHGQGHETIFKQIIADKLGIGPDHVHYIQGDSDHVFIGEGTGGSRVASIGGSAVAMAADQVIAKAKKIAAHMLKADDLELVDGVFVSRQTNKTLTMAEIAKASLVAKNLPAGVEAGLNTTATYQTSQLNFPNGCHIAEVEIDPETGAVEIVRYVVVDDFGTVLNPLLLDGQVLGGIAQGAGQVLMEEIRFDPDSGQILTGSFMDYAMPHADMLPRIEVKSHPVPTKTNALGTKGAGEAGCVGSLPALGNALVDALSEFGVRHVPMPASAETVWRIIRSAQQKAK